MKWQKAMQLHITTCFVCDNIFKWTSTCAKMAGSRRQCEAGWWNEICYAVFNGIRSSMVHIESNYLSVIRPCSQKWVWCSFKIHEIQNDNNQKVLWDQTDVQLLWKHYIQNARNELSKSVGIILEARKNLHKAAFVRLYYSFAAYPYFIYYNLVYTHSINLQKLLVCRKKTHENCKFMIQAALHLANKLLIAIKINN